MARQAPETQRTMKKELEGVTPVPPVVASNRQAKGALGGVVVGGIAGAALGLLVGLIAFGGSAVGVVVGVVVFAVGGAVAGAVAGGITRPQRELATEQDGGRPDV